jgi:hypothetical protein
MLPRRGQGTTEAVKLQVQGLHVGQTSPRRRKCTERIYGEVQVHKARHAPPRCRQGTAEAVRLQGQQLQSTMSVVRVVTTNAPNEDPFGSTRGAPHGRTANPS